MRFVFVIAVTIQALLIIAWADKAEDYRKQVVAYRDQVADCTHTALMLLDRAQKCERAK